MRNVELKPWINEDGQTVNALFIDDQVFDWGLVEDGLKRARDHIKRNPLTAKAVNADIHQHFVASFSEFVGRTMTLKEIMTAIDRGEME